MTKVLVDRIETQQAELKFGDPIGCHYHWTDPGEVDAYGDSVRHLAAKVELAVDAFERTAGLSGEVFAGEAADTLRERAGRRHEESATVRDDLRGLGRAINAYSEVLRRHRDGLHELRAYAVSQGLEVHDNRIWPPVATISGDAPEKERNAWERDWKTYQACFDLKIELRDTRRAGTRDLLKALADHAGVHPDKEKGKLVPAGAQQVSFGDLRREAAEEAMEAVRADDAADAARRTVDGLKRREQGALDDLEKMLTSGKPSPEEVAAQTDKVQALHRELVEARVEARDAEQVADREQAQANRAARDLEAAEQGKPRLVAEQPVWQPVTNLRDRLG